MYRALDSAYPSGSGAGAWQPKAPVTATVSVLLASRCLCRVSWWFLDIVGSVFWWRTAFFTFSINARTVTRSATIPHSFQHKHFSDSSRVSPITTCSQMNTVITTELFNCPWSINTESRSFTLPVTPSNISQLKFRGTIKAQGLPWLRSWAVVSAGRSSPALLASGFSWRFSIRWPLSLHLKDKNYTIHHQH